METDKVNPATVKPEQKKGLGRGLAALLGGESFGSLNKKAVVEETPILQAAVVEHNLPESGTVETVNPQIVAAPAPAEFKEYRIRKIPIDFIRPNNDQPRQHFEDGKLQELAESICEQGLIQPIIVRMISDQNY